MAQTWLYASVTGASLLLAAWQPGDTDSGRFSIGSPEPARASAAERISDKIDDRIERHKARWEKRKAAARKDAAP